MNDVIRLRADEEANTEFSFNIPQLLLEHFINAIRPAGLEYTSNSSRIPALAVSGGAKLGAVDASLYEILTAWRWLTPGQRDQVLAIVRAGGGRGHAS